jgi:hypothetical protein
MEEIAARLQPPRDAGTPGVNGSTYWMKVHKSSI